MWVYFWCQDRRRGRPSQEGQRRQHSRGRRAGDPLLSDLQLPRHLAEAAGQTKGEGRPVMSDGALKGGRERLGALPGPGDQSPAPGPLEPPLAPGCDSAPACRCAGSAGLRAGRACSSTRRSRRRCGRRGTGGRKCHTDLRRERAVRENPRSPPPAGSLEPS